MASQEGLFCMTLLFIAMILTVIMQGIPKETAELSVLMEVYTIPCLDRGYINLMFVLQSSTDPLHVLLSSSSETNATSDVCNFINIEVEVDVDVIEKNSIAIIEEVDMGIKQEEIPGDITSPDIKSEPDEVSYVCICLLLDTFYKCPDFFLWQYSRPIETAPLLGIKMFCWCTDGRVCTGWVGQHVIA